MYHDKEHPKKSGKQKERIPKMGCSVNILSLQLFLSLSQGFSIFLKILTKKIKLTILAKGYNE